MNKHAIRFGIGNTLRSLDRYAHWILLGFLAFAVLWKGGKSLESTWLLLGIVWILLMAEPFKEKHVPRFLWSTGMLFILWTIASFITSTTANYGLDEVLRTASFVLLFFWVIRRMHRSDVPSLLSPFLHTLAGIAGAAVLIGVAVYSLQPVNRFVGTFFDARFQTDYWPNAWGDFVLLSWPALLFWALCSPLTGSLRSARAASLRLLLPGALLGSLLLSFSRGSILAACGQILLLIILLVFLHMRRGERNTLWQWTCVSLITLCTAGMFYGGGNLLRSQFFPVQSAIEKATFTAAEGSSSIDERRAFWEQSFALSLQRPLLGWGPYSFRFVQPRLQEGVFATSDHAHNVFLKLAMERGWPAAILFAMLLLSIAWSAGRSLLATRMQDARDTHPLLPYLLVAIAGVIAHSLIDYNLQFVGNGLLLWMLMGMLVGICIDQEPNAQSGAGLRPAAVESILLSLLLIVTFIEGGYLITSSLGRHAEVSGDHATALHWYERSQEERFSRDLHLSRAHLYLDANRIAEAHAALDDYVARNREDARAWVLRGDVFLAEEAWGHAQQAYGQAWARGLYNHLAALQGWITASIRADAVLGDTLEEVLSQKENIDRILTAYAEAILHNVHFIALTPNVEVLQAITEHMADLFPEQRAFYDDLAKRTAAHATVERERLQARQPGMLW